MTPKTGRRAARRRQERAAAELREPPLRHGRHPARRDALPRRTTRTTGRSSATWTTSPPRATTTWWRSSGSTTRRRTPASSSRATSSPRHGAEARSRNGSVTCKPGRRVEPIDVPGVVLTGVQKRTITDRVQLPRLYLAWLTPASFRSLATPRSTWWPTCSPAARTRGCTSGSSTTCRSRRTSARPSSRRPSRFDVRHRGDRPRPGHTLAELEKSCRRGNRQAADEPPTAHELERAVNQIEASFYTDGARRRLRRQGRPAERLLYATGDPDCFNEDLARYRRCRRRHPGGRRRYLPDDARVDPERRAGGKTAWPRKLRRRRGSDEAAREVSIVVGLPARGCVRAAAQAPDRSNAAGAGPAAPLKLPAIQKLKLSNGIPVFLVERHKVPLVEVRVVRGGASADPREGGAREPHGGDARARRGHALRAGDLGRRRLPGRGPLGGRGWDATTVGVNVPSVRLGEALAIFADVVLRPDVSGGRARAGPRGAPDRASSSGATNPRSRGVAFAARSSGARLRARSRRAPPRPCARDQRARLQRSTPPLRPPGNAAIVVAGRRRPRRPSRSSRGRSAPGRRPAVSRRPPPPAPQIRARRSARRQARSGAVPDPHRPRRPAAVDAGLLPARRHEHGPRRLVHLAAEPEPAREAGLHLRRDLVFDLRLSTGPFVAPPRCRRTRPAPRCRSSSRSSRGSATGRRGRAPRAKSYVALRYPAGFETTGELAARLERRSSTACRTTTSDLHGPRREGHAVDVARVTARYYRPALGRGHRGRRPEEDRAGNPGAPPRAREDLLGRRRPRTAARSKVQGSKSKVDFPLG